LLTAGTAVAGTITSPVPISPSPTFSVSGVPGAVFSNFGCSLTGGGAPATCGQINVGPSPFNNGIEFTSGFTAIAGSFSDAAITYSINSTTGITGVDLGFNGAFFGLAVASVTEQVFNANTNQLIASLKVSCSPLNCSQQDPATGFIDLGGSYTNLLVEKDINVTSTIVGASTISIIDQSFHSVPEPASMLVIGSGLVALGFLRRKQS
jgi:hypothetical protein